MREVLSSTDEGMFMGARELYAGQGSGPDPSDYARGVACTATKDLGDEDPRLKGLCLNLPGEIFYPSDAPGVEAARILCSQCFVQNECLEYALDHRERFGVWGGASERERRRILKVRSTPKI